MLADERKRRQDKLVENIFGLSKRLLDDKTEVRRVALELKEIYTSDFRHSYSEFFPLILHIQDEKTEYSLDFLSENLESLRTYVETDFLDGTNEFKDMHKNFDKLCDHLNLEIGRVTYYSQNEKRTEDLSKRMESANKDMCEAAIKLEKASKKAESIQTELLSILSIFAAIVIAFSGGLSFLGGTLSGASDTYICKMILLLLMCGFVLFNTIFLLMYLVGKIIGRSIYANCMSEGCTCKKGDKPKCNGINRIRKRLPYVFYINILMLILTIADIVVWCVDKNIL